MDGLFVAKNGQENEMLSLEEHRKGVSDAPATPEERLAELRFCQQTGRLRDWQRPIAETMRRAGLGNGYAIAEWSAIAWYGPLDSWLHPGSRVSDMFIDGPDHAMVVVEDGNRTDTGIRVCDEWLRWTQRQLALRAGFVTADHPDDWRSDDGRVVHALYGTADQRLRFAITRPPYTPDGATVAVRVLPARWQTIDDLVQQETGVLPREAAELLLEAIRRGVTLLIAGGAGSGKTTLTAALLQAIAAEKRIIIIEDARELPLPPYGMAVEVLRSRSSFAGCVRLTLRQRPDLIVLGEVRGPEALAMLEAAATGHPGICTIHAPDALTALRNLERFATLDGLASPGIVRGLMTSGAAPLIALHIGTYGGRRRVGQIIEVIVTSGSQAGETLPHNTLFAFNPATNRLERKYPVQGAWGKGRL
ncbi:ATPase, T2SS/T4P/T4SS family [Roseiflexus castenholzii]|jgi:Flp pilus assembly CpaF family ATPase|uniref:Type II secretion system protein E n=1 Tax=Roseiflexus castenholzii (strain DSM 13941 / HLO8) TaxID=383372 RepID=A7NJ35_ROSCS|nr:ATPase, T2SS/T4P/T4SS family [Roseiflexus castenholzii]ABU57501.1 type II secretion system protein E [Roseiflexus castenholzii DSM 13941]